MILTPFHLAIEVRDIDEARDFYGVKLNLPEGRSSTQWIDFNLYGHQLVTHLSHNLASPRQRSITNNMVDGHRVPVPHFGVVLQLEDWQEFADRLSNILDEFIIEPYIRFKGEAGEQGTLFFSDPSGNHLEFKGFKNIESELFAN